MGDAHRYFLSMDIDVENSLVFMQWVTFSLFSKDDQLPERRPPPFGFGEEDSRMVGRARI